MNKLYTESGFLSSYGEDVFRQYLDQEITILLNGVKTEYELRIIGSLIQKRVGDLIADRIQKINQTDSKIDVKINEWANKTKSASQKPHYGLKLKANKRSAYYTDGLPRKYKK